MTAEERGQLKAARQKVAQDPKVKEAEEKFRQASREFHATMKEALLAADPSLGPVLEKLQKRHKKAHRKHAPKAGI